MRCLRASFALKHSGGAGALPGSSTRPCLEQADDLYFALAGFALFERGFIALGALVRKCKIGVLGLTSLMARCGYLLSRSSRAKRGSAKRRVIPKRKRGPATEKSAANKHAPGSLLSRIFDALSLRIFRACGAPRGARVPQGTSHKDFALLGAPPPRLRETPGSIARREETRALAREGFARPDEHPPHFLFLSARTYTSGI